MCLSIPPLAPFTQESPAHLTERAKADEKIVKGPGLLAHGEGFDQRW